MTRGRALIHAAFLSVAASTATAEEFEPKLTFAPEPDGREVALTLDACAGGFDMRILNALVNAKAKATIFVTARWMRENPGGVATLLAHEDLFEIENHGAMHVPPVTDTPFVFGIRTAGTTDGVAAEVEGGARAIERLTGRRPVWYRGATARYSADAIALIKKRKLRVAGYSVNADKGASLPAAEVARRMAETRSGDVVIAHINQPRRQAGAGVVAGIKALSEAGFRFVKLSDVRATEDNTRPIVRDPADPSGVPAPSPSMVERPPANEATTAPQLPPPALAPQEQKPAQSADVARPEPRMSPTLAPAAPPAPQPKAAPECGKWTLWDWNLGKCPR